MSAKRDEKALLRDLYFQIASQYYACARFAAFAGTIPVCGLLFHHAVEMYLKGYLCKSITEKDLKEKLRHNLAKAWHQFKSEVNDHFLDRFDGLISRLNRHEDIRYPESIMRKGMQASIRFKKASLAVLPVRSPSEYEVIVGEIDALVRVIYKKAAMNPTPGLSALAREYLVRQNDFPVW